MLPVPSFDTELKKIETHIANSRIPEELRDRLREELAHLSLSSTNSETFWPLFQKLSRYLDWLMALPWDQQNKDILDLDHARTVLDANHYGLTEVKERILEYIAVLIMQTAKGEKHLRAPILLFVGLVGTGKTTIAKAIAEVLGRPFVRIPFGGLGDPLYLRGKSRLYAESEPGKVIKGIRESGVKNPVILLDEIDRVADEALNSVMGVLVELLDPEQNHKFTDNYIDYPFDLSEALFCATCNNTTRIATAVMDRLEPIQLPSYTDEEKITIGRSYIFPKALAETGLSDKDLTIQDNLWPQIVRPLGFDAGVRTLKRTIEGLCRKAAKIIIERKVSRVEITEANLTTFIPRW